MQKQPAQFLLAILLFVAIVLAACGTREAAQAPLSLTAQLKELAGKVTVQDAGQDEFTDAQPGSTLHAEGRLQTGEDGRVRLDLSTGTIIRISPSSLFQLASNQEADEGLVTRLKLETGRLFIILNGGSMEVDTPSGVASVRGSYMMVEVDPDTLDVLVTCLEGSCQVENPAGDLDFTGGQKTVLFHRNANGQYTPPGMEWMTEEDFQKWLDENPEAADLFNQAMATLTAMAPTAEPSEEPTEVPTGEPTVEPGVGATDPSGSVLPPGDGSSCIKLVYPQGGAQQLENGSIMFAWESNVQAAKYIVTITYPNGTVAQFETTQTSLTRYLESMPAGGSYTWTIEAVGSDGKKICASEPGGFSKPEGQTWEDKKQDNKVNCTEVCDPSEPKCYQPSLCVTPPPTETPYNPYCDPSSDFYWPCPENGCWDPCFSGCWDPTACPVPPTIPPTVPPTVPPTFPPACDPVCDPACGGNPCNPQCGNLCYSTQ